MQFLRIALIKETILEQLSQSLLHNVDLRSVSWYLPSSKHICEVCKPTRNNKMVFLVKKIQTVIQ